MGAQSSGSRVSGGREACGRFRFVAGADLLFSFVAQQGLHSLVNHLEHIINKNSRGAYSEHEREAGRAAPLTAGAVLG